MKPMKPVLEKSQGSVMAAERKQQQRERLVLEVLADGPKTRAQILVACGIPGGSATEFFRRMFEAGLIIEVSDKKLALPAAEDPDVPLLASGDIEPAARNVLEQATPDVPATHMLAGAKVDALSPRETVSFTWHPPQGESPQAMLRQRYTLTLIGLLDSAEDTAERKDLLDRIERSLEALDA
jgi:hypothetical protein